MIAKIDFLVKVTECQTYEYRITAATYEEAEDTARDQHNQKGPVHQYIGHDLFVEAQEDMS